MLSYSYWFWRILACYATDHSPLFGCHTLVTAICPFEIWSLCHGWHTRCFSCFSEIYGLGNRPSLRFHLVLSGNGIYLVSGVHFVYISCVYIHHTISMLIPVHLGLSFDDLSCWHQCTCAGSTMLAWEILCLHRKYSALAENNICTNEPSYPWAILQHMCSRGHLWLLEPLAWRWAGKGVG